MYYIDFTDKHLIPEVYPTGLVIIEYPLLHSTRYTQFKQEMYDTYFKEYNRRPKPLADVSSVSVLYWLYDAILRQRIHNACCIADM